MLASMDKCKITTRDAMHFVSATVAALLRKLQVEEDFSSVKLEDLVLNRTTIQSMRKEYRRRQAQQILDSFNVRI